MSEDKIIQIIKSHIGHCGKTAEPNYALGYETAISNIIRDINGARQRESDGEMTELGVRNFTLISEAIRSSGSYDPSEILYMFEERLYVHEADTIVEFLEWIIEGGYELKYGFIKDYHRGFGHGDYEERFTQFLEQR